MCFHTPLIFLLLLFRFISSFHTFYSVWVALSLLLRFLFTSKIKLTKIYRIGKNKNKKKSQSYEQKVWVEKMKTMYRHTQTRATYMHARRQPHLDIMYPKWKTKRIESLEIKLRDQLLMNGCFTYILYIVFYSSSSSLFHLLREFGSMANILDVYKYIQHKMA